MQFSHRFPACLVAVCLCAGSTSRACGQAEKIEDVYDKLQALNLQGALEYKDHFRNGVRLRATKAEMMMEKDQAMMRLHWAIDYEGERWPLVILTPSLRNPTKGQTHVGLLAAGKDGKAYRWTKVSPTPPPDFSSPFPKLQKEWFTRIEKGKGTAEGTIELSLSRFKQLLLKERPAQFDERKAPAIYVWLEHEPVERGRELELDAWTGFSMAAPVKLAIKDW